MADSPSDNVSNCDSYVFGSHEDVLWSFEQQVKTMEKYGVVANSVEFEELERSLDEELKKYNIYDTHEDSKDMSSTTNNTSKIVHDGSTDSDSDPNLLHCYSPSTASDKLYKKSWEDSISPSDGEYRVPSDLDYYPTKQSPRVYPKSPKPSPRARGTAPLSGGEARGTAPQSGSETRDSVLDVVQPLTPSSPSRASSRNSSPGYSKLVYNSSTLPPNLGTRDHHHDMETRDHHHLIGNSGYVTGSTPSLLGYRQTAVSPPIQGPVTKGYTTASYNSVQHSNPGYKEELEDTIGDCYKIARPESRTSINRHKTLDNKEVELQDIVKILTSSSNLNLVNTAAGALQHLSCGNDEVKNQIREGGAIPVLVHLLSLDDLVCLSSLGVLRNLTFGRNNHLNRIAVQDAHGLTLLVQLLNTTQSYEIQELVTGVLWNLSSTDTVKMQILRQALESLVKSIIIPLSGWEEEKGEVCWDRPPTCSWTTVFRNATGCLKNLSSAGPEGRTQLRLCYGLVDSLFWTIRSAQGKNDVDNKAVENAVCILRNLSYRLESEVPPDVKYGSHEDWRSRGLGGGQFRAINKNNDVKKKKKTKARELCVTPLPDHTAGVGLLWQRGVVRVYLDLLLECSNPETLEGAAGALQNLSACSWPPAQEIREVVRREKGLSVLTSLLRLPNDSVIRATAFCLRNLAQDTKNKELLGKHAMVDLVKRLPGAHGNDGITDVTITAVLSALAELVTSSEDNAKLLRGGGGIERLVEVVQSHDTFTRQCVVGAHVILGVLGGYSSTRKYLKVMGWTMHNTHSLDRSRSDGLEFDENQVHVASYRDNVANYRDNASSYRDNVTNYRDNASSYRDNYQTISSPDPTATFDSHTLDRNYRIPSLPLPPVRTSSSSPNHPNLNGVAAPHYESGSLTSGAIRKSTSSHQYSTPLYDLSVGELDRKQEKLTPDLPPPRPARTSQRYHVSDSWV